MCHNQHAEHGKTVLMTDWRPSHGLQELYGAKVAGDLISALSRLFTAYLHFGGFTCGLDDLLLIQAAERERFELCETAELRALRASADFADVKMPGEGAEVKLLLCMIFSSFYGFHSLLV